MDDFISMLNLQSRLATKQGAIALGELFKNAADEILKLRKGNEALRLDVHSQLPKYKAIREAFMDGVYWYEQSIDAKQLELDKAAHEYANKVVEDSEKCLKMSSKSDLDIRKIKADAVREAAEYVESHQSTSKTDYDLLNEFAYKLEQGECLDKCLNTAEMSKKQVVREFLESVNDTGQLSGFDMQFLIKFADLYFKGEGWHAKVKT